LKGYQPIDPISLSYENNCFENIVSLFPNEATRVAIGKLTQDGSLAFGSNVVARKGESYTIIIDYIKYKTTSIPAKYSNKGAIDETYIQIENVLETKFGSIKEARKQNRTSFSSDSLVNQNIVDQQIKIPVYVGIGLRIQSNVTVLKDSLNINLGSLYNLGIAASQNQINGTLVIQTLGITGTQISSAIPIPDKINESTIQNAITSLATIKSKIYDKETRIYPQVVGFGLSYNIAGAKDLIEATLHSNPPKIKALDKKEVLEFEKDEFID